MTLSRAAWFVAIPAALALLSAWRRERPRAAPPACAASRYFEGYASRCEAPALPIGGGFCEYDGANAANACWDWSTMKSAVAGACR